ncbi:MAG: hypothetical protein A2X86_13110 [Bdellovibrionales bacterium GWA2_49_15]|nr:MAG: hypothetical protein A2X86_13110 [Bdellovibrionales bacterium GWA2_49_15]
MHAKWVIILVLGLFSALILYFVYKMYQHPKGNFINRESLPRKIVFFGDSHVHGRIGVDFVAALQNDVSNFEMINLGHNGDTAADLLERLDEVTKVAPEQIYLLVGSNDVLDCPDCQSPPPEFQESYKRMVETLSAVGQVFVISIPMMGDDENDLINTRIKAYNRAIAEISAVHAVKYLPFFEKMAATINALKTSKRPYDNPYLSRGTMVGVRRYLLGQELSSIASDYGFALTVDGLHFNQEGSQILMSLIIPELPL